MSDDDFESQFEDGGVVVVQRPQSNLVKALLAIATVLVSISLAATIFYLAPTVRNLSESNKLEKEQDACYDQFTADVTDGNAETLAASVDSGAALGALVVALARGQRDPATVDPLIAQIDATSHHAMEASQHFNAAIQARKDYVAAGRPLPCTNLPN